MPITRLVGLGEKSVLTGIDRRALAATAASGAVSRVAAPAPDAMAISFVSNGIPATLPEPAGPSLAVPQQTQEGNACGTTSLSMVLAYFGAPPAASEVTRIDAAIRPHTRDRVIDSFTAPIDLARYASRSGYRAVLHQDSRPEDLARLIDQGVPPIILYDSSAGLDGTGLHYVVVSGYRGQGAERQWAITDPGGYTWQAPSAELMRSWSHLRVNGVRIPYNRLMIAVAPAQGALRLPNGARTPAAAVTLPSANSPRLADWAGGVATGAIGVATRVYDTAQSVSGAVQQSGRWVQDRLSSVGSAVRGALGR